MNFDVNQILNKAKNMSLYEQLAYGAIVLRLILIIIGFLFF